jgi:SAM-dependent methyltransferase
MNTERDYVLGTHDGEMGRLALQHRVWRPRALDAWRRAGFTVGRTLLDAGCGPGHATLDLAEIVGPTGRIMAVDQSHRFLDTLEAACRRRGIDHVETAELDLDEQSLPHLEVDGAWCRWVLSFVRKPREVLGKIVGAVRPGGAIVLHEYIDYSTWRLAPRCPEVEEFVAAVMASWRAEGGEPDIALELPCWLEGLGLKIRSIRPIVDVVPPSIYVWQWPARFLEVGVHRLVELGHLAAGRAAAITRAFARREADGQTHMITPTVLEIIAVKDGTRA